jgi:hypothetical protein
MRERLVSLRPLEQRLFALIRAPQGVEAALAAQGLAAGDLERVVHGDERLSALGRVGIYADMYFWRLLEVLRGAFPKLVLALGDEGFSALAAAYLDAFPSRHPSLRFLGAQLPAFLRGGGDGHASLPGWAADLAALEWSRYDVFDEADAPVLTAGALAGLDPEGFAGLAVRLQPAHRVLEADTAVEAVWRALAKGEPPPESAPSPTTLVVWRQDITFVYHRPVAPLEREALALAAAGCTFASLCEAIAARVADDQAAAQAAFQLLARWLNDGLLVDGGPNTPTG